MRPPRRVMRRTRLRLTGCIFPTSASFVHAAAQLGKVPGETAAVVDLGGGSSQIMYAVESEVANGAPDGYVRSMGGSGANYDVYVKSFKGYGIMVGPTTGTRT